VRHVGDAHADARTGGYHIICIPQYRPPSPRIPRAETVAQAHGLEDARAQVRHGLQRTQFQRVAVRECSDEVGVQARVYAWCVDDVEGRNGQGKGGCFDAAANDDLGFFGETGGGFVGGRELRGEDFLKDGGFGVVGFRGDAGEGAGDEGALVLGTLGWVGCGGVRTER
jgi:hypothetical protein